MTVVEKAARSIRVDPIVCRQRDHHERDTRRDGAGEWLEVGIVGRRDGIDHGTGEVGVALHPTEPREVFCRRRHASPAHAVDECRDMARDARRVGAVLALQLTDRGVACLGTGRHDVGHRREVHVHARVAQLPAPCRCLDLEIGRIELSLGNGRRDGAEAAPGQRLDQAALLVGSDEEADTARRLAVASA